jgi:predicted NAD/FAD-binding protein
MLEFPAQSFVRFFDNHGLLSLNDQPQWMTVTGGSREYVQRLSADFADRLKLNCGAARVIRHATGVEVQDASGGTAMFDQVIFACHADQALAMLANPSAAEQQILGAFRYQKNRAVLHSDTRFMPRHKKAWASWVYLAEGRHDTNPAVSLSYWMNRLQPLPTKQPMIVTLNPARAPDAALVHDSTEFEHPVFDAGAIRAQAQLSKIQGSDRIWFCGAYQRYGFHEDGLMSGVAVAQSLGGVIPWS